MGIVHLARSAPVRLALAFASAFALVMGVLLLVIYWSMIGLLESHLESAIDRELLVLKENLGSPRDHAVPATPPNGRPQGIGSAFHVLVLDRAGKRIAGDLPVLTPLEGWQDVPMPAPPGVEEASALRAHGVWVDENTFVLVAHDTEDLVESRELILRSFGLALGVTVALALGGGLFVGITVLRRIDAASASARAIMAGDLSRRIETAGRGDEFDRLAAAFNLMLDRIEALMENLRHVTADIAHDLRTPLGRLRQRLEAARMKPRASSTYEATIDTAIEDTDAVMRTFDAVLRIAQIEGGSPRPRFRPVDLSGLVDNVCDAYTAVAEDMNRRLVASVAPHVTVHGDRELLTQLLANLVENALGHTSGCTSVEVRLERHHGRPRLAVLDHGPGIPAAERTRVFRRFYRLDRSRTTPGSGLGLSLVSAVAMLHEASIALDDNHPGLRVSVDFPEDAHG